jgi:hypothetical protein
MNAAEETRTPLGRKVLAPVSSCEALTTKTHLINKLKRQSGSVAHDLSACSPQLDTYHTIDNPHINKTREESPEFVPVVSIVDILSKIDFPLLSGKEGAASTERKLTKTASPKKPLRQNRSKENLYKTPTRQP